MSEECGHCYPMPDGCGRFCNWQRNCLSAGPCKPDCDGRTPPRRRT